MEIELSRRYMDIKRSTLSRIEIRKPAEKRRAESKTTDSGHKSRSLGSPITMLSTLRDVDPTPPAVVIAQSRPASAGFCDNQATILESTPSFQRNVLHTNDFREDEVKLSDETEPMDVDNAPPAEEIHQNSRLLDLPTELRIRIFDCLLERSLPVCLLISTHTYLWGQGLPKDIASCARVCRHLNAEVQDIIWQRLNFKIRADNGHGLPSSTSLGTTETCDLLRRMRRIEICFPIAAIRGYGGDPDPAAVQRLKICAKVLEKCSAAREISFNCDTNAYVGEHDDKGVDLVTRTFRDVLVLERSQGVRVKVVNKNLRSSSAVCAQLLREAGLL